MASPQPTKSDSDYVFKLLLIGDSMVGKSCLITRYADDYFEPNFIATIGVDFKMKTVELDGKRAALQIWDTAGQERFCNITRSYYKGSDGILIVYDVTNRDSYNHVSKWLGELDQNAEGIKVRFLVGNKCDLVDKRVVTRAEGEDLAARCGLPFFETSALTGEMVADAFAAACAECKKEYDARGGPRETHKSVKLTPGKKKKKPCAC
eukprot:TRINITY_DN25451_c0_g1_i1.p1 TRINITY_DN25451_c0_g1~~TRINITY_DN25451_c0_g1_i1.p1  ORF type:complete len:207 (+),score=100.65 TRINITY_DN25451_c0_g1_i1:98-718(+)